MSAPTPEPAISLASLDAFYAALSVNSGISFACIVAFCLLRPLFLRVYAPRSLRITKNAPPLPKPRFCSWLMLVLRTSDEQFGAFVGLDGLMFIKYLKTGARLFLFFSIVGLGVLLPVNMRGDAGQLDLDRYTLTNLSDGAPEMWLHFVAAWLFSFATFYALYNLYDEFVRLRQRYAVLPGPAQYSVLVENIPVDLCNDERVAQTFMNLYNRAVFSAQMIKDTASLDALVAERDAAARSVQHYAAIFHSTGSRQRVHADDGAPVGCCGGGGSNDASAIDAIAYWSRRLDELNATVSKAQHAPVAATTSAIVSFNTLQATTMCAQTLHSRHANCMTTRPAPEPRDLLYANLAHSHLQKRTRRILVFFATAAVVLFFNIPIALIQSLTWLKQLAGKWDFLGRFLDSLSPAASALLLGFLPTLVLPLFYVILAPLLHWLTSLELLTSRSESSLCTMQKFFAVQIVNVYLANLVVSVGLDTLNSWVSSPLSIAKQLGDSVPRAANFFTNYVMLEALTGYTSELLRPWALFYSTALHRCFAVTERDRYEGEAPGAFDLALSYPKHIIVFVIGLTYAIIAPIILPFAFGFFLFGSVVMKYQLMFVYVPQFESGGAHWPQVFARTIIGLVVGQLTLIGVFSLRGSWQQFALLLPLPALSLYFFLHCRTEFEAVTRRVPVEVAVDNELQPEMPEYRLDFLDGAYVQPSLREATFRPVDAAALAAAVLHSGASGAAGAGLSEEALNALAASAERSILRREFSRRNSRSNSLDGVSLQPTSAAFAVASASASASAEHDSLIDVERVHTPDARDVPNMAQPVIMQHLLGDANAMRDPTAPRSQRPRHDSDTSHFAPGASSSSSSSSSSSNAGLGELLLTPDRLDETPDEWLMVPSVAFADAGTPMELIHQQGVSAPPLVFELVRDEHAVRPYFSMPIPVDETGTRFATNLCCRKKANEDKFRFVLGDANLEKRGNPNYIGKMSRTDRHTFMITLASGMQLAEITVSPMRGEWALAVEILNRYVNVKELGARGKVLRGVFRADAVPALALQVDASRRPVFEVHPREALAQVAAVANGAAAAAASGGVSRVEVRYAVDFDYPMTIFLSFAVVCAIETLRQDAADALSA